MLEDKEIKQWIENIIGMTLSSELSEALKDGTVLCDMINIILSKNGLEGLKNPSTSAISFFQMENIEYFIRKARECGVPDCENFQTIDLFEGKNMKQVLICINSLSRNLFKNGRSDITVIGPKLVEKVPIVFTQEQLNEAKRTISNQYGTVNSPRQFY